MSLRTRLLVAMVLLAAVGLLAADLATFRFLRSTLIERVDQQLTVATRLAIPVLSLPDFQPEGPGPGSESFDLFPGGTYAAVLDDQGIVTTEHVFRFGQDAPSPPALPGGLPGSAAAEGSVEPVLTCPPSIP